MSFVTASTLLLGLAWGFGAAIWIIIAAWHANRGHKGLGFWYVVLAIDYLACTGIIVGRTLGNFQELPRGTSLILLAPILAIPPAIQLLAWLNARRLLRDQRGG